MQHYPHLQSPIQVGAQVFKNRLVSSNSMPHFLQANEKFPALSMITHLANRAANGAAMVTVSNTAARFGLPELPAPPDGGDIPHMPRYDLFDPKCQNYFIQLADAIHYYGAHAALNLSRPILLDYSVDPDPVRGTKAYTKEVLEQCTQAFVDQAVVGKSLGFEVGSIHIAYGHALTAEMLSHKTNHRTDEYGGSLENRARFLLDTFKAIKAACGPDYVLEILLSGVGHDNGYSLQEAGDFLKLADPYVDLVQVRMEHANDSHPTGFMDDPTPALTYAAYFKTLGLTMKIAPVGGFQDLDAAEEAIATGKCDMITAARAFICDFDYGKKMEEGRGADVTPCIRCNKCHVLSQSQPYLTGCSVNPKFGLEHVLDKVVAPLGDSRKVAIVGGGPAGMEAALVAAQRGHRVTLFEKADQLGGQLIPASVPSFKWPVKDFKDWLIAQVAKSAVEVRLNTEATAELLAEEGYDAIFAATGATPILPPIPGVEGAHVHTAIDLFNDPALAKGDVVVVGGGEIGVEAGLFLAKAGHTVTLLEMTDKLAKEANRPHYYEVLLDEIAATPALTCLTQSTVSSIGPDAVTYTDSEGVSHTVPAGTVIIAAGSRPNRAAALPFHTAAATRFRMIGDCDKIGSIMEAMRTGFAAASNI